MAKNPISKQSPDSQEDSADNLNQEQPETSEQEVPEVPNEDVKPKTKRPSKDGDDSQTEEGYTVPEGEEMYFHAEIEQPNYDRATGERLSEPFITKQNPGEFANFIKFDEGGKPQYFALGYRMHKVLHTPASKYLGGVRVETVKNRKQVFVSIQDAIELNKQFLTKKKA